MGVKWDALFENERKQFGRMTEQQRFAYFLLLQYGSPYGWGKENPESSDCSGAVCLALYAATGLLVRTTADELYRRVFTAKNPGAGQMRAAFFITNKDRRHGDGFVKAGTVIHVAGLVDEGVLLNSQEPSARVRALRDVQAAFEREGAAMEVRGLDREALARLATGGARHGIDGELARYFE